jgi:hypothetical protein
MRELGHKCTVVAPSLGPRLPFPSSARRVRSPSSQWTLSTVEAAHDSWHDHNVTMSAVRRGTRRTYLSAELDTFDSRTRIRRISTSPSSRGLAPVVRRCRRMTPTLRRRSRCFHANADCWSPLTTMNGCGNCTVTCVPRPLSLSMLSVPP